MLCITKMTAPSLMVCRACPDALPFQRLTVIRILSPNSMPQTAYHRPIPDFQVYGFVVRNRPACTKPVGQTDGQNQWAGTV